MDENKLLQQIGTLIDEKLNPIKEQLDTVELKIETVNQRVEKLDKKIENVDKKIGTSQKDTIDTLTELIHTGYALHEEKIKKLEENLASAGK